MVKVADGYLDVVGNWILAQIMAFSLRIGIDRELKADEIYE
jgi:hypothetical protein